MAVKKIDDETDFFSKYYDKAKKYLWPSLFLPLFLIYGGDLLIAIIKLAQVAIIGGMSLYAFAFIFGIVIKLAETVRSFNPETIFAMRLTTYFPMIKWGYDIADWLMVED